MTEPNTERNRNIIRLLQSGLTPQEVKDQLGLRRSINITYWQRKLKLPRFKRGRRRGVTGHSVRDEQIAFMSEVGIPQAHIAKVFGVARQRINQVIFRHKHNARVLIYDLKKAGKLQKPKHCQRCRKKAPLEAHHPDYSKPDFVKWLCRMCHKIADATAS